VDTGRKDEIGATFSSGTAAGQAELVDAGDLRFEVLTAGDPSSARLALCLHGFPEHAYSWRHQLPVLAELGYRVWAPNQRGYGGTRPRPAEKAAYHVDHLLADVAALIEASRAESVTLIGHDWGGLVAWIFALREVAPIDRLVVMNLPHPQRFAEALRDDPEQRRRSFYERLFQLPGLPEWFFRRRDAHAVAQAFLGMAVHPERFPESDLRVYRDNALEPGAMTAMLNWYRANPFRRVSAGPWPRLRTPTLMIWGVHDQALGKKMTEGTDALVDDFTLHYLEASHWVQQDAPDEVNAILRGWLGR
jgi:pimeloyl-ACP methyl ester carboxylesterase